MKTFRASLATAMLSGLLAVTGDIAHAQDGSQTFFSRSSMQCQPGVFSAYFANQATYTTLLNVISPELDSLEAELRAVVDQTTYEPLLAHAQRIAANPTIRNGRVLVTLPDGTVMIDTGRSNNSFANFQAKAINENHHSRVAIFAAQQYPCGVALERKFSTSTGVTETYVTFRLGTHLDSDGTVRISSRP
jgi:hypothetical protein